MVFAHTYVFTRMMNCTSLTNDDIAGFCCFATEQFNA